jgi:kynurenine formamidase
MIGGMTAPLTELLAQLHACRWVDLTHAFAPGIPHYSGFPDEKRTVLYHFDEGVGTMGAGFLAHRYSHVGQWGTHCDPPAHFAPGGRTSDEIAIEEMILPLVVLDLRAAAAADPDLEVGPEHVLAHEAEHGTIPAGCFVAASLGWGAKWPDADAMANLDAAGVPRSPGWGAGALRLLVEERGVTAIGHDVTDTDPGARVSAGDVPAETYILGADRWQLELMANLDAVPPRGALIVATWPKPLGGTGFPARAFAILPPT